MNKFLFEESVELQIKNTLVQYLKSNFEFTGNPLLVEERIKEMAVEIYEIFFPNTFSRNEGEELKQSE